jgi:sugar-specific transcriptional regulator TrmB
MTVKPELMKRIREQFSLNIYETKVWLALLGRGIASAGEIAEISGVPRSRTYDVLEALERQGFTIAKLGKPIKYLAVSPSVVIERLKSNLQSEANEKTKVLSEIRDTTDYKDIELLYKNGIEPIQHEDMSSVIKGRANIYSHMKDFMSNAKNEVLLVTNVEGLTRKSKFLRPLSESLKRKGVKLKIGLNATDEEIKKFKDIKADIFKTDMKARFCLIDREHLLFMLSDSADENQDSGIWIKSPFFSGAISSLLDKGLR